MTPTMKIVLTLGAAVLVMLGLLFVVGVVVGPQPVRAQDPVAAPAATRLPAGQHDLHGLARLQLPREFRFRGLDVRDTRLSPAEQLQRHDDPRGLVFRFEAHARNDWGGHARDPMLLNVVLMNPAAPPAQAERRFSIGRYHAPTGQTIPLDDPRWQQQQEAASGGTRHWRWLAMNDHFGSDEAPRWALSVYEPARALRLDLFVWRELMSLEQARGLLARTLDVLTVHPARDAHFQRGGTHEDRMAALREARIAQFFAALAPLGVVRPAPGATSFGTDTAAWLDADQKALRALRVLAQVKLPPDLARDGEGRPLLPLVLKPGQYPGPTTGGLPSVPLGLLYWHADSQGWRISRLQRATLNEAWPLLPFEREVVARLPDRDSAYLVHQTHVYQPPALDDAAEVTGFLADAERWRGELLAGRIVALPVLPGRLLNPLAPRRTAAALQRTQAMPSPRPVAGLVADAHRRPRAELPAG